ncbi:tyrosine-type recombinase/integrase [Paracoccus niistensis]|uniref:Tyrosine-type recombinase/integrase n=1 Tax=Paracoccus niistensis TaxID=632935 RepID=A0ABV6I5F7_9RHOB
MKNKLTSIGIKKAPGGVHRDGDGLQLEKAGDGGKWVYRYSHLGKRREMGLGSWPTVGLADARRMRDEWKGELAAGRDPITVRKAQRAVEVAARDRSDPTFAAALELVFDARKASLRGDGTRGKWMSQLTHHVLPSIGHIRIKDLTRHDIVEALKPIWHKMPPTAEKAYVRLHLVLKEAQLMGYDCNPLEAVAASRILGDVRYKPTPFEATPWQKIPDLYAKLGNLVTENCLRWMILTCVRAHGCVGARFDEIDGDVWTVPAERIKAAEGKAEPFRVPLSSEALRVLERLRMTDSPFLFSQDGRKPIAHNSPATRLTNLKEAGRPHGFRASFRTWVQDTEACSWEVSEMVLGHAVGNKVERAYARSDLLDRRRIVMEAWARHVTGEAATTSNVVSITKGAAG